MEKTIKIRNLYRGVVDGCDINDESLKLWGFDDSEIKELLDSGEIEKDGSSAYKYVDASKLYYFGTMFLKVDKSFAYKCFTKCLEIDPSHEGANFNVFFDNVLKGKFQEALKYLSPLMKTNDKNYWADINCYLLLLNLVIDLPDEYKKLIKELTAEDVLVEKNDRRYKNIIVENMIRTFIFEGNFNGAIKILNDYSANMISADVLMRSLLLDDQNILVKNLSSLCEQHEYEKVLEFLNTRNEKAPLPVFESIIKNLARVYLNIQKSGIIPQRLIPSSDNVFALAESNNFGLALKAIYPDTKGIVTIFKIVLEDLCALIEETEIKTSFDDLTKAFLEDNLEKCDRILITYLISCNKMAYFPLISGHFKLCMLENDKTFEEPITILARIKNDAYEFDMTHYNNLLNSFLKENKWNEAQLVLEMLVNFCNPNALTLVVLPDSVRVVDSKENGLLLESSLDIVDVLNFVVTRRQEMQYVDDKVKELLQDKGIVLLEPMLQEERSRVLDTIDKYPDINALVIGEEPRRLVLHYVPTSREYIDIKELLFDFNTAYTCNNYENVITIGLEILKLKTIKSFVCIKMGMAYFKLGDYKKARDYLIVATELAKEDRNRPCDFTEQFKVIEDELSSLEQKNGGLRRIKPKGNN